MTIASMERDIVDELLDLKQAAEMLGVSEKSLLRLLAQERVPARKIVGKWRFSRNALHAWIASGDSQQYAKSADSGDEENDN